MSPRGAKKFDKTAETLQEEMKTAYQAVGYPVTAEHLLLFAALAKAVTGQTLLPSKLASICMDVVKQTNSGNLPMDAVYGLAPIIRAVAAPDTAFGERAIEECWQLGASGVKRRKGQEGDSLE